MTVCFIGAGPGAPDLITVRGLRLIERCAVCVYAGALVPEEIVAAAPDRHNVIDTTPMALWDGKTWGFTPRGYAGKAGAGILARGGGGMRESLARGAPLCPVGHLPRRGGDRRTTACGQSSKVDAKNNIWIFLKTVAPAISLLAGEMSQRDRGGRLAPKLAGSST
jgi:hypothetical protein